MKKRFVGERIPRRLCITFLTMTMLCVLAPMAATAVAGDAPIQVSADSVDPQYAHPVIDSRMDLATPIPIHRVTGHFEGTDAEFAFYFPPKAQWKGRFFQQVYPLGGLNAPDETLRFGAASGAYTVHTIAPSGYRANAAAAKFSRVVAREYYGEPEIRIYGYIYGGSGGSFQTIGAIENSTGVWDGAVPYVIGVPTSIPNNFFVRAFARLVLKDKAEQIADAVRPGGSGKPSAGLNGAERAALAEVTAMGVPLRGWDDITYMLGLNDAQGLLGFADTVRAMDPTYADDFWSKPGYLGTETSALGNLVRAAKVDQVAVIGKVEKNANGVPTGFHLEGLPAIADAAGLDYTLQTATGASVGRLAGSLDPVKQTFSIADGNTADVLAGIHEGAPLRLDNRWAIALTSYHRHQVPTDTGFGAWDQFRDARGKPRYPQRSKEIGAAVSLNVSGGGTYTGKFQGKMIVIANLLDVDAFPWDGDWYAQRVKAAMGKRYDDSFRLWLNDNADHQDGSVVVSGSYDRRRVRLVDYRGILQQAVRDVSAWVEDGVAPPASTRYRLRDGQVSVAEKTAVRGGIQPTVELRSKGQTSVEVAVGEPVTLRGWVEVPPKAGSIVAAEWSSTGQDDFIDASLPASTRDAFELVQTFTYATPGTYYPVLRVASQRQGDASTQFGLVRNLGRIRVVVR